MVRFLGCLLACVLVCQPVAAQPTDDPCQHFINMRWIRSDDPTAWAYIDEFRVKAQIRKKTIVYCTGYDRPSPYGSFIGGFSFTAEWNKQSIIIIAIDERFVASHKDHLRALFAHELAHHFRGSHEVCGRYFTQGLVGKFVSCESRVDILGADWTSHEEMSSLLKAILEFKRAYYADGYRYREIAVHQRIKLLEQKQ